MRRFKYFCRFTEFFLLMHSIQEWGTTTLTFEEDPEPFGRVRDQNIITQCKELNIDVIVRASHTLYKLDRYGNCKVSLCLFSKT